MNFIKSKIFKCLLLTTTSTLLLGSMAISLKVIKKSSQIIGFDNAVENTINLCQVNYWHNDEPESIVTGVQTVPVSISISTNNIVADIKSASIVNSNIATTNIVQNTKFSNAENSGSYQNVSRDNEERRAVNWQRVLADYITYKVSKDTYSWGSASTKLSLDVEKIWEPNSSINNVNGNIVYQNDEVYENMNHDFYFSRGISKDMKNTRYNVWAIPYTYAKEIQCIYVAYNFESRYLYTLQANSDFNNTSYNYGVDNMFYLNNSMSYLYDLSQLISIKRINYPTEENQPIELVLGFNDDILTLYNQVKSFNRDSFINSISSYSDYSYMKYVIESYVDCGLINTDNLNKINKLKTCKAIMDYCQSVKDTDQIYLLFQKYNFVANSDSLKIVGLLMSKLNLKVNITTYDHGRCDYIETQYNFSADSLKNNNATIQVCLNNENKYWFRINSLEVDGSNCDNVYLAPASTHFNKMYSTDAIDGVNDHFVVKQPEYYRVEFNENAILEELKIKLPSEIVTQDLVNTAVIFYDKDNNRVDVQKPQYYHISLSPDDLTGSLKVIVSLADNNSCETIFNFNRFHYEDFLEIDITNLGYNIIDDIDDEKLWQILLNNGWFTSIRDNYFIVNKDQILESGMLKFNFKSKNDLSSPLEAVQVTIKGYDKYYVRFNDDSDYLKKHPIKDIDVDTIRKYLIDASSGYLNKHSQKYDCTILPTDGNNNSITIEVPYENELGRVTHTFTSSYCARETASSNNLTLYICLGVVGLGMLMLFITLLVYFLKKKKHHDVAHKSNSTI